MNRISIFLLALGLLASCAKKPVGPTSNALMVIAPYSHAGTWVFDDPSRDLHQEPFVVGVPRMIDALVSGIPGADKGFRLLFSAQEFPGYTHLLEWRRADVSGNWYYSAKLDAEGWLCPAFLKYFSEAPKKVYVKAEAK